MTTGKGMAAGRNCTLLLLDDMTEGCVSGDS